VHVHAGLGEPQGGDGAAVPGADYQDGNARGGVDGAGRVRLRGERDGAEKRTGSSDESST
jgi:hypothetical protein